MSIIVGVGVTCLLLGTLFGITIAAVLTMNKQTEEAAEKVWK